MGGPLPKPSDFRVHPHAGQDFKCSPGTELVNPGLRYLKALLHPDPRQRGLPVGVKVFVLEADSSEGEAQNKSLRVAVIYLFIYQDMCLGRGCWVFWWREIGRGRAGGSKRAQQTIKDKMSLCVSTTGGHAAAQGAPPCGDSGQNQVGCRQARAGGAGTVLASSRSRSSSFFPTPQLHGPT